MMVQYIKRCAEILKKENIEFEKEPLVEIVKLFFPDFRLILNMLQMYGMDGKIDARVLNALRKSSFTELVKHVKGGDFKGIRDWTYESVYQGQDVIRYFWENGPKIMKEDSLPQAALVLHEGQKDLQVSVDKELCMVAVLTVLANQVEFK